MKSQMTCFRIGTVCLTIVVFMTLRAVAAEHTIDSGEPTKPHEHSCLCGERISDSELEKVKREALLGSRDAAQLLVGHYAARDAQHPKSTRSDFTQLTYWLQIAAENGDSGSQCNYASVIEKSPDPQMQLRAKFWYERAKAAGFHC